MIFCIAVNIRVGVKNCNTDIIKQSQHTRYGSPKYYIHTSYFIIIIFIVCIVSYHTTISCYYSCTSALIADFLCARKPRKERSKLTQATGKLGQWRHERVLNSQFFISFISLTQLSNSKDQKWTTNI